MIICDGCEGGWHMGCLDPPLTDVPEGKWLCPTCRRTLQDEEDDQDGDAPAEDGAGTAPRPKRPAEDIYTDSLFITYLVTGHIATNGLDEEERRRLEKRIRRRAENYTYLQDGVHRRSKDKEGRTIYRRVPTPEERYRVIAMHHNDLGHLGVNKTLSVLTPRYYWPGMTEDVKAYIRDCDACAKSKLCRVDDKRLHSLPIVNTWVRAHMDLIGPYVPTRDGGFQYVLVCVDSFTKYVEAVPIRDKSADSTARALQQIIARHSCPQEILIDQGPEWKGAFQTLCAQFGIRLRWTNAYNPQGNGQVEAANKVIVYGLAKQIEGNLLDTWNEGLDRILFGMRVTRHGSTKVSPFLALYGREPRLPGETPTAMAAAAEDTASPDPAAAGPSHSRPAGTHQDSRPAGTHQGKNPAPARDGGDPLQHWPEPSLTSGPKAARPRKAPAEGAATANDQPATTGAKRKRAADRKGEAPPAAKRGRGKAANKGEPQAPAPQEGATAKVAPAGAARMAHGAAARTLAAAAAAPNPSPVPATCAPGDAELERHAAELQQNRAQRAGILTTNIAAAQQRQQRDFARRHGGTTDPEDINERPSYLPAEGTMVWIRRRTRASKGKTKLLGPYEGPYRLLEYDSAWAHCTVEGQDGENWTERVHDLATRPLPA
jgi:transposase InsO family protein